MAFDLREFVLDPKSDPPELEIYHRNGVDWLNAPTPDRQHTCQTQTFAWTNLFTAVHRCACGAIKISPGRWGEKNSKHEELPTAQSWIVDRLRRVLRGGSQS